MDGCAGRSTGTSPGPQIADDFFHCASRQRWVNTGCEHTRPRSRTAGFVCFLAIEGVEAFGFPVISSLLAPSLLPPHSAPLVTALLRKHRCHPFRDAAL
jgi:hypothetical protein